MGTRGTSSWLVTIGLIGMVAGMIDPLEGSVVILPAAGLVALGTYRLRSHHRRAAAWGFSLLLLGFAAMWTLSALGGVGGSTGRSVWWSALVAPFVVGWLLAVVAGVRSLIDRRRQPLPTDPGNTSRPRSRRSAAE